MAGLLLLSHHLGEGRSHARKGEVVVEETSAHHQGVGKPNNEHALTSPGQHKLEREKEKEKEKERKKARKIERHIQTKEERSIERTKEIK